MAVQTRKTKVKGPQQITVLSMDLAVLRKIDMNFPGEQPKVRGNIIEMLGLTQLEPGVPESEMPWFSQGFVSNDHPREAIVASKLVQHTIGFAVARTDTGEILREYGPDGMRRAEAAVANAKPVLSAEILMDDEDEAEDEPEVDAAPVVLQPEDEDEAPAVEA